jgi:hypothetical protein
MRRAVSTADGRKAWTHRARELFGADVEPAVYVLELELVELEWHDCYGEVAPPDPAVEDRRDLQMSADAMRR